MLNLCRRKIITNKIIAPTHLYFSIIVNINEILLLSNKVFIISNQGKKPLTKMLTKIYQHAEFNHICIGNSDKKTISNKPEFLNATIFILPIDMSDSLSLIGAGPWAENYCNWIKHRGGIAIDVGTGFDLMLGSITRPVHNKVDTNKIKTFQLK